MWVCSVRAGEKSRSHRSLNASIEFFIPTNKTKSSCSIIPFQIKSVALCCVWIVYCRCYNSFAKKEKQARHSQLNNLWWNIRFRRHHLFFFFFSSFFSSVVVLVSFALIVKCGWTWNDTRYAMHVTCIACTLWTNLLHTLYVIRYVWDLCVVSSKANAVAAFKSV